MPNDRIEHLIYRADQASRICRANQASRARANQVDHEKLTVNQNFRVSPVLSRAIEEDAAELALSTSAYLRACVYLAGPMLMQHPALADLNRRELAELAANICKILVIRPATVSLATPSPAPSDTPQP